MRAVPVILIVVMAFLGSAVSPANAADFVVDGPAGCAAIGGEWEPTQCRVHKLVIQAADALLVSADVALYTDGPIYNYGRVETRGVFQPLGRFTNRGILITYGITVPVDLVNTGTFVNRGWLHLEGGITNEGAGTFENEGYLETCAGAIVNRGYLHNTQTIENWGTLIVNEGIFVNDAYVHNPNGDMYRIDNSGAFENRGTLENEGTFTTACGGAFYGGGSASGNPVRFDACEPVDALQILTARVLEVGPNGTGRLTKKEVQDLGSYLASATKELQLFQDAGLAARDVRRFVDAVGALEAAGRLPRIGAAFAGWAGRVLTLLE